jgi:hypothetical protein
VNAAIDEIRDCLISAYSRALRTPGLPAASFVFADIVKAIGTVEYARKEHQRELRSAQRQRTRRTP